MAATVDDLIATMHSGVHVGQEGYDLRALQAHLAQTLYHPSANPSQPGAGVGTLTYHPVAGTSVVPPAPVSSLTSQLSAGSCSDHGERAFGGYPLNKPNVSRPQVTPMASFRGFAVHGQQQQQQPQPQQQGDDVRVDDDGDMEMEMDMDEGIAFRAGNGNGEDALDRRRKESTATATARTDSKGHQHETADDMDSDSGYSAFESDAFAPLYNPPPAPPTRFDVDDAAVADEDGVKDGGDRTPTAIPPTRSTGSGWEAFQKRPTGGSGWDRYGFNLQPFATVTSEEASTHQQQQQQAVRFGSAETSASASSIEQQIQTTARRGQPSLASSDQPTSQPTSPPAPTGLPTPPEEKAIPRPRSSPTVHHAPYWRSGTSSPAFGTAHKIKRRSGLDEHDRRKWEGRLRSAAAKESHSHVWDLR